MDQEQLAQKSVCFGKAHCREDKEMSKQKRIPLSLSLSLSPFPLCLSHSLSISLPPSLSLSLSFSSSCPLSFLSLSLWIIANIWISQRVSDSTEQKRNHRVGDFHPPNKRPQSGKWRGRTEKKKRKKSWAKTLLLGTFPWERHYPNKRIEYSNCVQTPFAINPVWSTEGLVSCLSSQASTRWQPQQCLQPTPLWKREPQSVQWQSCDVVTCQELIRWTDYEWHWWIVYNVFTSVINPSHLTHQSGDEIVSNLRDFIIVLGCIFYSK